MKSRGLSIGLGLLLAVLGVACLNYTNAWNHEHHVEWSEEHGMPEPSGTIFFGGAALAVFGGFLLGRAAGRRSG